MTIPPLTTLDEAIDFDTLGIFGAWSALSYTMPWADTDNPPQPTATHLDDMLRTEYGDRYINGLTRLYIKRADVMPLDAPGVKALAQLCYTRLYGTLRKLYLAMLTEYNPLNNYDMLETETNGKMRSGTDTTTTTPAEYTQTTTDKASGLDSTGDGADTNWSQTGVLQGTNPGSSAITYGSREDGGHTLTRSGNIGVQTSQEMEGKSIDLFARGDYWEKVVQAVAEVITIPF